MNLPGRWVDHRMLVQMLEKSRSASRCNRSRSRDSSTAKPNRRSFHRYTSRWSELVPVPTSLSVICQQCNNSAPLERKWVSPSQQLRVTQEPKTWIGLHCPKPIIQSFHKICIG